MMKKNTYLNLLLLMMTLLLYVGVAQGQPGYPNLVSSCDFQAGNTGFASNLSLGCNMCAAGSYCASMERG